MMKTIELLQKILTKRLGDYKPDCYLLSKDEEDNLILHTINFSHTIIMRMKCSLTDIPEEYFGELIIPSDNPVINFYDKSCNIYEGELDLFDEDMSSNEDYKYLPYNILGAYLQCGETIGFEVNGHHGVYSAELIDSVFFLDGVDNVAVKLLTSCSQLFLRYVGEDIEVCAVIAPRIVNFETAYSIIRVDKCIEEGWCINEE